MTPPQFVSSGSGMATLLVSLGLAGSLFVMAYALPFVGKPEPQVFPPSTWADDRHPEVKPALRPVTTTQEYYEREKRSEL